MNEFREVVNIGNVLPPAVATVLFVAGCEKAGNNSEIKLVVSQMPYLPKWLIGVVASLVWPVEIAASISFIFDHKLACIGMSAVFFVFFVVSMWFSSKRRGVRCACFGNAFEGAFSFKKSGALLGVSIAMFLLAKDTHSSKSLVSLMVAISTLLSFSVLSIKKSMQKIVKSL